MTPRLVTEGRPAARPSPPGALRAALSAGLSPLGSCGRHERSQEQKETPRPRKNPRPAIASPLTELSELPAPPANPEVQQIPLRDITPSLYQPRRFQIPDAEDPDLVKLARSIRAKGVIQLILVRPMETGYELVAGERRVRASCLGLPAADAIGSALLYIPAIVRELSDTEAGEITVEENLRRKDLRPLEEADGVHTLLLLHKGDLWPWP